MSKKHEVSTGPFIARVFVHFPKSNVDVVYSEIGGPFQDSTEADSFTPVVLWTRWSVG